MREPTPTEALDLVGRFEAGQALPERLREEVGLLGALLGDVLRESGGDELYDDVERLRLACIQAYTDESDAAARRAADIVDSLSPARAEEVARAFTVYFHLVNLAEEHHRVRTLAERLQTEAADPKREKVDTAAAAYAVLEAESGPEVARERLAGLRFHPVFTAHPTEARRRAVSASIRRLSNLLPDLALAGPEGTAANRRVRRRLVEEIDTLWRTAPLRENRPTPLDEVRAVMGVFDTTLYRAAPAAYRALDEALQPEASGDVPPLAPAFLRVGTWVGGDRDGNPYVTAPVTRQAADIAAEHVLRGLAATAERVGRTLTLDARTTPPSPQLEELWAELRDADEESAADIAARSPAEPHRRVVLQIARRIVATRRRDADLAYADPAALLSHLRIVQASLAAAGAARHAYGELQEFIWQVETYGFHLAEIEVRQHSAVHARVLAALEDRDGDKADDAEVEEVLATFRAIAAIQRRHGQSAAGRYIVSFTQSADDLAAVFALARHAVGENGTPPSLDVIPLFETFADLQAAPGILAEAVRHPEYARRLEATDRRAEVMLGYSDSSKDVGPVAATLALAVAQSEIAQWAREEGIALTLFHGRGGALGRGGGPANAAILAQPPHSVEGRFKLTEQGEVIFARYGDPDIARRHIDQVVAATLLASAPSIEERNARAAEEFAPLAATLDAASRERFFSLVKADGFPAWFATVTPMEEIGQLALGSRPARRGLSVESLADLRAIPWVFSWTQARINLAGWFGLGTALAAVEDDALLAAAYERWPLFRTMIDNVAMSLAKTDERIAEQYLALGDRDDLAALVRDEMRLTRERVVAIAGGGELLANKPVLQRAVKMRSPYVDALSLLQLRALRALRAGGAASDAASGATDASAAAAPEASDDRRLLLLAVSGVSAGLQNTG